MWPVPDTPPEPFVSLVGDVATIQNSEIVWCEPDPEAVITGWMGADLDMSLAIVPNQPVVLDLRFGQAYTIRAYSPLGPAGEPREFYEAVVVVPEQPRPLRILAVWDRLLRAYLEWRDLGVTPEEHAEALRGGNE